MYQDQGNFILFKKRLIFSNLIEDGGLIFLQPESLKLDLKYFPYYVNPLI